MSLRSPAVRRTDVPVALDPALVAAADTLGAEPSGGSLLQRLAQALEIEAVPYCQWAGHSSAHRWATGHGDVDLLVDRASISKFRGVVDRLGFKPALPSGERQIPGVESYFGPDQEVPRLLHLHVHYHLVLGDYWRTTYRLPIERVLLDTAVPGQIFRIPAPPYQYLVYVLRMVLRQRHRLARSTRVRWLNGVQIQLDDLEERCDREALAGVLRRHLPSIDPSFFERCARSLRAECSVVERWAVRRQLHWRLRAHARRPPPAAVLLAGAEKGLPRQIGHRLFNRGMRPAAGGAVVALIGGDGSGKTTCAGELRAWLSTDFPTMHAHLGRPPRSMSTIIVGGALKLNRATRRLMRRDPSGSYVELLRYLCTARDRYRLYESVRQFAAAGGIAICERYPVPQNRFLVGPSIPCLLPARPDAFTNLLASAEASFYERMLPPDVLIVLLLDPELAVIRKPDEPADYVRARGRVIWETDWTSTRAQIVDVSLPLPEVLRELKSLVWSAL